MSTKTRLAIAIIAMLTTSIGCSSQEKEKSAPDSAAKTVADTTGYRLLIGKPFPNIEILDLDGTPVHTGNLISRGRVIVFLEPTCSYCAQMISKWRSQFEEKRMLAEEVVAIVPAGLETARAYARLQSIPFAVYVDTGFTFMNRYQVTDFPLQLVVGRSGTIHDYNFQIERQIFPDQIHRQFEK